MIDDDPRWEDEQPKRTKQRTIDTNSISSNLLCKTSFVEKVPFIHNYYIRPFSILMCSDVLEHFDETNEDERQTRRTNTTTRRRHDGPPPAEGPPHGTPSSNALARTGGPRGSP